ncbi:hypothetical protein EG327_002290 [Venturia inaequalis]|uniref:Uncharacterized protein n=1 Tax=Venturia inaequalis TaxID=5025 RepID=A0A8H3ZJA8_VENIN|nr:hypothetical protein EG327_002290 [Venturia inaequalis]
MQCSLLGDLDYIPLPTFLFGNSDQIAEPGLSPTTYLPFFVEDSEDSDILKQTLLDENPPPQKDTFLLEHMIVSGWCFAVFFPAPLAHKSNIAALALPEVFFIPTSELEAKKVTWLVQARDIGSADDKDSRIGDLSVRLRGIVSVDNAEDCFEDASMK